MKSHTEYFTFNTRLHSSLFGAFSILVALGTGCGSPPRPHAPAEGSGALPPEKFAEAENEILRDLAALDRRIARRAKLTPSEDDLRRVAMGAVLHEDGTVAVIDGAIDPFSFDARARGLESAKQKVAVLPLDPAQPSERDLLSDLVDAEFIRLDEERGLPRSASALVRAIVDAWQAPKGERQVSEVDRWLVRRLVGVRESLTESSDPGNVLDVVRARELDDALDALERLTGAGLTASTQELVKVRDAVERASSRPAAKAHSDWTRTARRMRAYLGLIERPDELVKEFSALESDLRARAGGTPPPAVAVEKHVFVSGPCNDEVPGSRVRSMAAAPEREPSCYLRHLVATSPDASPLSFAVMHDHVVVAQWALDVARGATTIAATEGKHPLLAAVAPEVRTRLERIALARPVSSIGTGLTVKILMSGDPRRRAIAWSSLGDVPLDVATRELAK